MDDIGFGLPKKAIESLEAPLKSFTFDSIVSRLDQVFSKGWSYHISGPDMIQVPKRVPKYPKSKNPRVFQFIDVPHWQCLCAIEIIWPDKFNEICREYSVLVPATDDGSFELARDLAFIYTALYGLGVGKASKELIIPETTKIEVKVGEANDVVEAQLKELAAIKRKLGISINADLEPFIAEWNPDLSTILDINKTNLRSFINFLRTKLADEHARQPDQA